MEEPTLKLTSQEGANLERMVEIKAQYLSDAISAIREVIYLINCHPNAYRDGHPNRDVQGRMSNLASLSNLFGHAVEDTPEEDLECMVQVNARYLADATGALDDLGCNVEWHAETYRGYRGYCHPEIEIPRRISEVVWLRTILRNIIEDNQDHILKLEQVKDEKLSEVQPVEEYCCDGTHPYMEGSCITQDDKGPTKDKQITGKMFCDGQRAVGLLLRALGARSARPQ